MFRQNIGILNAMIRITCGLTFLSYSTVRMIHFPWRGGSFWMMVMAAMKVAEGITRFCPVVEIYNKTQAQNKDQGTSTKPEAKQAAD